MRRWHDLPLVQSRESGNEQPWALRSSGQGNPYGVGRHLLAVGSRVVEIPTPSATEKARWAARAAVRHVQARMSDKFQVKFALSACREANRACRVMTHTPMLTAHSELRTCVMCTSWLCDERADEGGTPLIGKVRYVGSMAPPEIIRPPTLRDWMPTGAGSTRHLPIGRP